MSQHPSSTRPWALRSDLRLALITGLGAGFGLLSPIDFGYYIPLTTAAVLSSSYGNSLKLSFQRMLGSVLGLVVLLIFSRGLEMPLPLGLGLALTTIRLFGGAFGLQVGYKVAGNIVIMGWLVHQSEETGWGMMRLFWTAVGIALSLWATRTIWPSQTIPTLHRSIASLVSGLAEDFPWRPNVCANTHLSVSPCDADGNAVRSCSINSTLCARNGRAHSWNSA